MTHDHTQASSHDEDRFGQQHWEGRYAGDRVWSGNPNGALVTEVSDLTPGRALDVGCGEGADSLWLARQGWQVTALDIAGNAVRHTLAAAQAEGLDVAGVVSPFQEADLPLGGFDLVSAMYPVLAATPEGVAERRLRDLVAPGGTLLVVHHDTTSAHAREHGFSLEEFVGPAQVATVLTEAWEIVVDEVRPRQVTHGAGAGHTDDVVLRAVRRR